MRRPRATPLLVLALAAGLVATAPRATAPAGAQSEGTLRDRVQRGQAQEQALGGAVARLSRLEQAAARDVAVLQGRVDAVQADLAAAEARAARAQTQLRAAQARVARLRSRLAQVRRKLALLLRERYVNGEPSLVTVVVNAEGFADLLETVEFVHRVQRADTRLLEVVRTARADATRERRTLAVLTRRRVAAATAVRRRRDALAGILTGLRQRRDALAQARAARAAALTRTRAGRQQAQRALDRLLAERARLAASTSFSTPTAVGPAPGGGWAVPAAIVQCESGGQNLTPNSAGASGYYQMLDSTWHGLGGSTSHAYQASKAEQDRLASGLWAGGSGARNWVCAALVR